MAAKASTETLHVSNLTSNHLNLSLQRKLWQKIKLLKGCDVFFSQTLRQRVAKEVHDRTTSFWRVQTKIQCITSICFYHLMFLVGLAVMTPHPNSFNPCNTHFAISFFDNLRSPGEEHLRWRSVLKGQRHHGNQTAGQEAYSDSALCRRGTVTMWSGQKT